MTPAPHESDTSASRGPAGGANSGAVRSRLTWGRIYHATSYLKSALWTVPLIAIALELVLAPRCARSTPGCAGGSPSSAGRRDGAVPDRHHADAVVPGVHVRLAAGGDPDRRRPADAANHRHHPAAQQRRPLQRRPVRVHAGVRRRARSTGRKASVHELVALVTALLGIACIADFLFLIDYAARLLRPVSVVARVGDEGMAMIKSVYPDPATALTAGGSRAAASARMPSRARRAPGHLGNRARGRHSRRWWRWRDATTA